REGDVLFVGRHGEFAGALREVLDALGVGLVVGVDLDGQFARRAAAGGRDPQVGAALVDEPLAVGAEPRPADAVLGVRGGRLGPAAGRQALADDVGDRRAAALADVVERPAVGRPHRRGVLAVVLRDPTVVGAVGVADPDVVVRRPAIALAVPGARPADVGD